MNQGRDYKSLVASAAPSFALVACAFLFACSQATEESAQVTVTESAAVATVEVVAAAPANQDNAAFAREQEERRLSVQKQDLLVDSYLAAARQFVTGSDFEKAEASILQALQVRATDAPAIEMLKQVRSLQGHNVDTLEEMGTYITNKRALIRQQQLALVNDGWVKANQAHARKELDEARIELENAKLMMDFDPYQTDFGALRGDVGTMLARVGSELSAARKASENSAYREAYESMREQEDRRVAREAEQLRLMLVEAIESFQRQDFDNAELLARKVLNKDPRISKARELLDVCDRARHASWRESFFEQRREEYTRWLEQVRETQVPYTELLQMMDADRWEELGRKRRRGDAVDAAGEDSEAVKVIKAKLENESVSIDYGAEPASFNDVIRNLRATQGLNIVVDSEARTAKGEEPVSLTLVNQKLGVVLKTILENLGLAHTYRDDVLYITTKEKAYGKTFPRIYEVRDLTVALPHFKAPDLTLRNSGTGEAAKTAIWGEDLEKTTDTTLDRLLDLLRENVGRGLWGEVPGFNLQPGSGQIVATATPEIHKQVESFLNDLRRFTKVSVHVEARFISINKAQILDVGTDFRGLGGSNPGTLALLDDVTNGAPYNSSAANDNGGPGLPAGASLSPSAGAFYNVGNNGDIRARTENIFNRALGGLLSSRGGMSLSFSILDDVQLGMLMRAVEKTLDSSVVNAPRLTIYNNQRANLTLVNQISYVRDYDVEVAQTAYIADPVIDVVQDGLTLDVRPTVTHDRKYVELEVQPALATIKRPMKTFESSLSGLTSAVVIEMPELSFTRAQTNVRVPDGGYVVIGGMKYVKTEDFRSETPILSDIPILSFFFSRKGRSDEIRDLIVVLHVKILDLTEQETLLVK